MIILMFLISESNEDVHKHLSAERERLHGAAGRADAGAHLRGHCCRHRHHHAEGALHRHLVPPI